jgi:hypothetical protein
MAGTRQNSRYSRERFRQYAGAVPDAPDSTAAPRAGVTGVGVLLVAAAALWLLVAVPRHEFLIDLDAPLAGMLGVALLLGPERWRLPLTGVAAGAAVAALAPLIALGGWLWQVGSLTAEPGLAWNLLEQLALVSAGVLATLRVRASLTWRRSLRGPAIVALVLAVAAMLVWTLLVGPFEPAGQSLTVALAVLALALAPTARPRAVAMGFAVGLLGAMLLPLLISRTRILVDQRYGHIAFGLDWIGSKVRTDSLLAALTVLAVAMAIIVWRTDRTDRTAGRAGGASGVSDAPRVPRPVSLAALSASTGGLATVPTGPASHRQGGGRAATAVRESAPAMSAVHGRTVTVAALAAIAGAAILPIGRPGYLEYAPFTTMAQWWPTYASCALATALSVAVLVWRTAVVTGVLLGITAWSPVALVEASRVPTDGVGGAVVSLTSWIGAGLLLAAAALLLAVVLGRAFRGGVRVVRIPVAVVVGFGVFLASGLIAPAVLAGFTDDGRARFATLATALVALVAITRRPALLGAAVIAGIGIGAMLYPVRDLLPSYSHEWRMDRPLWVLGIGAAALAVAVVLGWTERPGLASGSGAPMPRPGIGSAV